ncbi:MAG: Mor transcription activator family protein [Clostridia bacterium]|nr:Mor transcription activator family protein [Clostridia bacterium]
MLLNKDELKAEHLNGAYSELAELIGVENALKIHKKYRGTSLFFPLEKYSKKFIAAQIVKEYDGHNIRYLATKYGYTEKWIRKIIKENKD